MKGEPEKCQQLYNLILFCPVSLHPQALSQGLTERPFAGNLEELSTDTPRLRPSVRALPKSSAPLITYLKTIDSLGCCWEAWRNRMSRK